MRQKKHILNEREDPVRSLTRDTRTQEVRTRTHTHTHASPHTHVGCELSDFSWSLFLRRCRPGSVELDLESVHISLLACWIQVFACLICLFFYF